MRQDIFNYEISLVSRQPTPFNDIRTLPSWLNTAPIHTSLPALVLATEEQRFPNVISFSQHTLCSRYQKYLNVSKLFRADSDNSSKHYHSYLCDSKSCVYVLFIIKTFKHQPQNETNFKNAI